MLSESLSVYLYAAHLLRASTCINIHPKATWLLSQNYNSIYFLHNTIPHLYFMKLYLVIFPDCFLAVACIVVCVRQLLDVILQDAF